MTPRDNAAAVEVQPTTMAPYMWAIRDDPRLTGTTLFVAMMHAAVADISTGEEIFMMQETMAEKMGFKDRRTVGTHQKILRDLGYLQIQRRRGRNVVHRLTLPVPSGSRPALMSVATDFGDVGLDAH